MTALVSTITGADLPPLGWQHKTPLNPATVAPVTNGDIKPHGGLWTSPMRSTGMTGWIDWCADNSFGNPSDPVTAITADPDARAYVIDTHDDLLRLEAAYRNPTPRLPIEIRMWPAIDWTALARDVDALWLTDAGQWATRYTTPGLYGWDCEMVFWFRVKFSIDGSTP